jgi:hypothetical protein
MRGRANDSVKGCNKSASNFTYSRGAREKFSYSDQDRKNLVIQIRIFCLKNLVIQIRNLESLVTQIRNFEKFSNSDQEF